jgi:cystathionine beta-lyase
VFESQDDVSDNWQQDKHGYSYGLYGTPTTLELSARIADLENAHYTFIVPGGQAAIALIYLAYCKAGTHALVPYSVYGPNNEMAKGLLAGLNIEVEAYDPLIGRGIKELIRDNTALVWCESPGSVTMEVQDVPAIVEVSHERGVKVALDNTYSAGVLFDAFAHGVDVSMQALTKYIGGHSDLLLGSVSVAGDESLQAVGDVYQQLGLAVSPDDCSLALRGLQTLAVRLDKLEASTLEIARWLSELSCAKAVFHPALESCPGHEHWKRDFTGSSSVFSFLFKSEVPPSKVKKFVDSLEIFLIGLSWGGVNSLAVLYPDVDRPGKDYGGRLVRLNVGLEATVDLIKDIENALGASDISTVDTIIDVDRYLLGDDEFRSSCKSQLDEHGVLVLPDFLTTSAIQSIVSEGRENADQAFYTKSDHNVYLQPTDREFDLDHARNKSVRSSKGCITTDQIPDKSLLHSLYGNSEFKSFLCSVLAEEALYEYADPLSAINLHYASDGQELGWHFDNSSFAITLLIQQPEAGADFEYVKNVRNADTGDMNYAGAQRILDGETAVTTLNMEPGCLVLFRGRNSLHRVTPTVGDTTRMLVVLAYNTKPGISLSESARMTFYGRLS